MTSPTKFFSAALEAAEKLTQKSGTREQMKAMLEKYGAKPSELDYIGLPKFLADKPKVTRQELLDYIDANQVKPEEVLKRGDAPSPGQQAEIRGIAEALIRAHSADAQEAAEARLRYQELTGNMWEPRIYQPTRATPEQIRQYGAVRSPSPEVLRLMDHENDAAYAAAYGDVMSYTENGGVKWPQYTSKDPSMDYTEHLVTLPPSKDAVGKLTPGPHNKWVDADYMSSHWEEPNVLAHMRYDYDPDALRLEELQSDWLQQGRKEGFKLTPEEIAARDNRWADAYLEKERLLGLGPTRALSDEELAKFATLSDEMNSIQYQKSYDYRRVPRAPLANSDDWVGMLVRRALLDAAEKDKKKLRITSGKMQDARYSPNPGRRWFYDKTIPNVVNKYLKPYGSKLEPGRKAPNQAQVDWWANEANRNPGVLGDIYGPLSEDLKFGERTGYWEADIPDELKRRLLQKGKVPFFKHGGAVR